MIRSRTFSHVTCHSRGRGGTNIFAKATETECRRNLESFQSVASEIRTMGITIIIAKATKEATAGEDSASRNGSPRDQHFHGLGSRHDLGSFQSAAYRIPIEGVVTIFAKENRHSHGWRNDPAACSWEWNSSRFCKRVRHRALQGREATREHEQSGPLHP